MSNSKIEHSSSELIIDRSVFKKTPEEKILVKKMKAIIKKEGNFMT
jgi:hypothetical protein|tara:strand:- start:307 stop:444 length:138 start_codon:yes stop_codon:yes gene_type:complete